MNKRILIFALVATLMTSVVVATASACITLTPGYWKNHDWPVSSVTAGGVTVTEAETLNKAGIMWTAPKGDVWIILAQKVVAAKLSMLADPNTPDYAHWDDEWLFYIEGSPYAGMTFEEVVADADEWLQDNSSPVKGNTLAGAEGLALASWIDFWLNWYDEGVHTQPPA